MDVNFKILSANRKTLSLWMILLLTLSYFQTKAYSDSTISLILFSKIDNRSSTAFFSAIFENCLEIIFKHCSLVLLIH